MQCQKLRLRYWDIKILGYSGVEINYVQIVHCYASSTFNFRENTDDTDEIDVHRFFFNVNPLDQCPRPTPKAMADGCPCSKNISSLTKTANEKNNANHFFIFFTLLNS